MTCVFSTTEAITTDVPLIHHACLNTGSKSWTKWQRSQNATVKRLSSETWQTPKLLAKGRKTKSRNAESTDQSCYHACTKAVGLLRDEIEITDRSSMHVNTTARKKIRHCAETSHATVIRLEYRNNGLWIQRTPYDIYTKPINRTNSSTKLKSNLIRSPIEHWVLALAQLRRKSHPAADSQWHIKYVIVREGNLGNRLNETSKFAFLEQRVSEGQNTSATRTHLK